MRKVALVFVLAVFVPSLVLAWLAVRSLRDQQFVLERQRSLLYQGVTDSLARNVQNLMVDLQHEFGVRVEELLAKSGPAVAALTFDDNLRTNWPLAQVGFVVDPAGSLGCPVPTSRPEAFAFCEVNGRFLTNREIAEVYWNVGNRENNPANDNRVNIYNAEKERVQQQVDVSSQSQSSSFDWMKKKAPALRNVNPQGQQAKAVQGEEYQPGGNYSKLAPAEAEFKQLIGESNEGTLARFVDNKLNVFFWYRSPRDLRYVFGAQLSLPRLTKQLQQVFQTIEPSLQQDICVALLDENARPAGLSRVGFATNWKHPFASTEVGEQLPHWEAAAYLVNPARLTQSARTLKLTLGLLIAVLVAAIGFGSWLIVADLNRQLTLARQKTDFVSNVSHELKTPLTSIRMFSELLAEGRVADQAKQRSYLSIITAEAARLTRLINNVLDFSRMERGEKKYTFQDCDLAKVTRETAESYRPHLENSGFKFDCTLPEQPLRVRGDCDALAQIIVNLLSNAEKYSNSNKDISIQVERREGPLPCAEVRVLDRGLGVPPGSAQKIFEKFYRAHDSLSSGIQGSGLGLTLARQIARAHGGEVVYESREGGGSCFCLRLPTLMETTDEQG